MKLFSTFLKSAMIAVLMVFFTGCEKDELNEQLFEADAKVKVPTAEAAGNNLSFPVIWAERIAKTLRTPPANIGEGEYLLAGTWWYVWGPEPLDPDSPIFSCAPSTSEDFLCIDQTDPDPDDTGLYKAYVQKDAGNFWEAFNANANSEVYVDFVDWGDNLETTTWTIQSRVRTELVVYENVVDQNYSDLESGAYLETVTQYPMRHVYGWGTDEVHGLQTDTEGNIMFDNAPGDQATVYSTLARMTIQKLDENANLAELEWVPADGDPSSGQWTGEGINSPILNKAIYEAGDGPEFFNAEVNVKGKIIYGYTWDLKKLNEGTGYYRITYSFDDSDNFGDNESLPMLNTFLENTAGLTLDPNEDEGTFTTAEEGSGGIPMLNISNNLTFMDIYIGGRTTGGGGGNSGGNGGGGNNGGGNGRP